MAETRRYLPAQHFDIRQILQEAQHRWLRPAEICEILRNYQKFNLTPEPPTRPPAGSVFLFDRKALRFFRKDGHRWRKKKDGKTVKEAHEKLKAGSVDVLHCYYAHGEDNESFQRRSYWMLDGHLEHIVLVHYREVNEGHKATITHLLADQGPHTGSHQSLANSPASTIQTSCASTANRHYWSGQTISPELEDVKSLGSLGEFNQHKSVCHPTSHDASFLVNDRAAPSSHQFSWSIEGHYEVNDGAPLLAEVQTTNTDSKHEQELFDHKFNITGVTDTSHSLTEVRLEGGGEVLDMSTGTILVPGSEVQVVATASEALAGEGNSTTPCSPMLTSSTSQAESKRNRLNNEGNGDLKKLDSFGRWMDKEIGRDCDDSLMASDSGNYWNNLSAENDDKEVSSFSRQMQFDIDSPGPSLSQEQLFSIADFSPEWAYSEIETKLLIVGKFLQSKDMTKWSCMFGEIEVSAERLTDTSIRCVAPPHAPGRVPFYITCSNRLACSEVREFEYREMPLTLSSDPQYELQLQIRLAKLLRLGVAEQLPDCSDQNCDKCELKRIVYSTRVVPESEQVRTDKQEASILEHMCSTNTVLQSLLKDRLYRWLVYKIHEKEGKGPQVLDEEGQGVLHLAAALGYEWAVGPIVAAGVNPNFRDVSGRTALHWASYFGREETVIALLRFGADTSLVDDPKPEFPGGQTAADLASRRGHKGIAAYLAEVDLTSRLSSLTVEQNLVDYIDEVASVTCSKNEEELSIKGSLAAIRKSARAAALIQAALRARSFRQRQWTSSGNGRSEASTDLVALGFLNRVEKMSCYDDYLHSAAIRIQQKYRGWKGRREFLKIRNRIVKVQACVRGHQVRRQYKKFVWSVSIVEKVILRWRRKRVGLRAFRVENNTNLEDSEFDGETGDEYDFLRIGRKQKVDGVERALARVKSLVRDPKARHQYMRLATRFDNCKIVQDGESAS